MCGIFGFNFDGNHELGLNILNSGLNKILHRGPDSKGIFIDKKNSFFMGMRRLSIIDVNSGDQPFHNEDKTISVVFNGEIYNYIYLKKELERKGHIFHTNSDTEIIPHMFEEYGEYFPDKLNGMFAISLFTDNHLYLYRDRFGIKPLYFYTKDKNFCFGSELKSFNSLPFFKKSVSDEAVYSYLAIGNIPSPHCVFKNTCKLKPSHFLKINLNNLNYEIKRYYNIAKAENNNFYRSSFEILRDSSLIRTISDVPLGVFLSGGIDSSAIVAMLSLSGIKDINTFSVSFKDEGLYDESKYARIVSSKFKTHHHELQIKMDYNNLLEKFFYYYDEPYSDASAIPTLAISNEASKYVKVVLSGTGGDEVFLGYRRHKLFQFFKYLLKFKNIKWPVNKISELFFKNKKILRNSKFNYLLLYLHRIINFDSDNDIDMYKENLSGISKSEYTDLILSSKYSFYNDKEINFVNSFFPAGFDFSTYLESDLLVKEDRATMASSIEGRVPFLDHRLVESVFHIDYEKKLKNGELKHILKSIFRGILPDNILFRKKQGFAVPIENILKASIIEKEVSDIENLSLKLNILNYIDKNVFRRILSKKIKTDDYLSFIWRLVVIEKFLLQL